MIGMVYLGLFGILLLNIMKSPGSVLAMAIFTMPALLITIYRSYQRIEIGSPMTAKEWFFLFLEYLGKIALAGFAFVCVFGFWMR